ncbi:MAG: hypothetical protein EA380_09365 [Phycisphaeraceae bacterium]|nr:MAG: hypothetical protein EA380_09365 [Phycisphaeraceae bacterium]
MPAAERTSRSSASVLIPPRSRTTRALHRLGSPRLGMILVGLLAAYAALGAIPIGSLIGDLSPLKPSQPLRAHPAIDLGEQQWFATPIFLLLVLAIAISLAAATCTRLPLRARAIPGWLFHTGALTLAIGALIYAPLKQEGVILLPAPIVEATGPPIAHFLADHRPTLVIQTPDDARTIPLTNLPLHTDHATPWDDRTLDIPLPNLADAIRARITGYAARATPVDALVPHQPGEPIRAWSLTIESPGTEPAEFILAPSRPPITHADIHLEALDPDDTAALDLLATELPRNTTGALSVSMHAESSIATPSAPARLADRTISITEILTSAQARAIWGSELGPVAIARIESPSHAPVNALVTHQGIFHSDARLPSDLRIHLLHAGNWRATFSGVTAIVRAPDATVRTMSPVQPGGTIRLADHATIRLRESFSHVEHNAAIERLDDAAPLVGAAEDRTSSAIRIALESQDWSWHGWIPYARLAEHETPVTLPDGRTITLAYRPEQVDFPGGKLSGVELPGVSFALADFRAEYHEGGRVLRDLTARIIVYEEGHAARTETVTLAQSLGIRRTDAWWRTLTADRWRISIGAWDEEGWERSRLLAASGLLSEPGARFVVLRIGDAPGIGVIALGAGLIGLGALVGGVGVVVRGGRR